MSDIAIRVKNLSKQYRIGRQEKYRTFRDTLADAFTAPFRRVSGLLRGNAAAAGNLTETIWALKDVSFEIKQGEVVGIIGRNGAGKSTLLKILSRITEPTEGRAEVYGRVGALLEVGTGFHPELTGRENIYLNGAILGMSRAEIRRKFDEIVAFAEVEKFIDTPVKHYSSGMGLRLGFAVAAHLEPEILIVDEVLAVGDVSFQRKCLGKMGEVAGEGRTVLFVSHNMGAVNALCRSAMVLEAGQIAFWGNVNSGIAMYLAQSEADSLLHADLANVHRTGTGAVRFEGVRISAGQGEPRFPATGEDMQIHVRVCCVESVRDVSVCVVVWDSSGGRLIDANTRMANLPVNMSAGEVTDWTFTLHNVLLRPAKYRVELWAGIDYQQAMDHVPNALVFEVNMPPEYAVGTIDYPGAYRCTFDVTRTDTAAADAHMVLLPTREQR